MNSEKSGGTRELQVNRELGSLYYALEKMDKVATQLCERLEPVLSPSSTSPLGKEEGESAEAPLCVVAAEIRRATVMIETIQQEILYKINRLEI